MKIGFSEIRDTVDGAVGYVSRIVAGADRVRDALLFSPPGYFHRPMDEDDTTGTEDAVHVEDGSERIILGTNNSNGWDRILDTLGRAFDRGETVITAEDGTGRAYMSVRPGGSLVVSSDSGGGNEITITADSTTGDLTLATTGDIILDTDGVVKIGDAVAAEYATMFTALKSEVDANSTKYNAHVHLSAAAGAPTGTPITLPVPPGAASIMALITNACRSAKARINS